MATIANLLWIVAVDRAVVRPMQATGLDQILTIDPSRDAAFAALAV